MQKKKDNSMKAILFRFSPILVFILIFVILELAVQLLKIPVFILPSPFASIKYIFTNFSDMWPHIWATMYQYLLGFPIGSAIGIILALVFISNKTIFKAVDPFLTILACTPQIILVPLLKIWLGYGAMVSMIVCILACFSSVTNQMLTGASMIPKERFELIESFKGTKFQTFIHIIVPSVWPSTFTGLRLGAITGLAGVIGGEMIGGTVGIGYVVKLNTSIYLMVEMFSYVYVLMAFGYIVYNLISAFESRFLKFSGAQAS
jgi:NitT/TauT family transport system permease protein